MEAIHAGGCYGTVCGILPPKNQELISKLEALEKVNKFQIKNVIFIFLQALLCFVLLENAFGTLCLLGFLL